MLHWAQCLCTSRYVGKRLLASAVFGWCGWVLPAAATTVRVETSLGVIDIELFDTAAQATVTNFLSYVQSAAFDGTFFHRSVSGFVVQGGGFRWNTSTNSVASVATSPPVVNEFSPLRSNLRGTVAMAKLGGNPDSATSQWFVNLANNAANLDAQNGGFTVFGQVLGNGMAVVDAIASLPVYNVNFGGTVGTLSGVPVNLAGASSISAANLVMVNRATILPAATSLGAGWNLLGNGSDVPLDVANVFADSQRFVTIWKWLAAQKNWAFYSPMLVGQGASALQDYATSKGYQVLRSIEAGEGYWVNTNQAGSIPMPYGNAVTASALGSTLVSGWNLATVGTRDSPKQFCQLQSTTVTSLWAWDNPQTKWYFYAPNLDAQGAAVLTDYIGAKGYLDFISSTKKLGPEVGFWVNKL